MKIENKKDTLGRHSPHAKINAPAQSYLTKPNQDQREAMLKLARKQAQKDVLSFTKFCWWRPEELVVGPHTEAIADRLTQACEDFKRCKSTFLMIQVPHRHGKSTLIQAFTAYFLARFQSLEPSVILSGYGKTLAEQASVNIKKIMESKKYQYLFPGILPDYGTNSKSLWQVKGSSGQVLAQGLGGSLTGFGAQLIICDDTIKNFEQSRSKAHRERTWNSLKSDLLSRINPNGSIVVVIGTPWSTDDCLARIEQLSKDARVRLDTAYVFPNFEIIKFPAKNGDGTYLFENRMGREWYEQQYATLGKQSSALLDLSPMPDEGSRFDIDNIKYHDDLSEFPASGYIRAWDLASSDSERKNSDWTVGILGKTEKVGNVYKLWIKDIVAIQAEAPKRNALIEQTAINDGAAVRQAVESYGGYKDAYTTIKDLLRGKAVVHNSVMTGDKSKKLAPLEVIFDNPEHVNIYRPGCQKHLNELLLELATFPDCRHDDFLDPLGIIYDKCKAGGSTIIF